MTKASNRFSPEVRARAVRMVLDHQADYASQWAAMRSLAPKFGCTPAMLPNMKASTLAYDAHCSTGKFQMI